MKKLTDLLDAMEKEAPMLAERAGAAVSEAAGTARRFVDAVSPEVEAAAGVVRGAVSRVKERMDAAKGKDNAG